MPNTPTWWALVGWNIQVDNRRVGGGVEACSPAVLLRVWLLLTYKFCGYVVI